MVLLTMTPPMVDGLASLGDVDVTDGPGEAGAASPPSLSSPALGKPITHQQVVDLWKKLQSSQPSACSLEALLRGAGVYVPPPPPKPEPSREYKALMARLRREEAERAYQRMVDPRPRPETLGDGFPTVARAFAEVNRPVDAADLGDDDVTYREVHRQVMLIINFLVSIVGVAATLWVAARWWTLPARVFLCLGGAVAVAVAEVGVYQAYVYRMARDKSKQKAAAEVREVVETWVVGRDGDDDTAVLLKSGPDDADETLRRRRPPGAVDDDS